MRSSDEFPADYIKIKSLEVIFHKGDELLRRKEEVREDKHLIRQDLRFHDMLCYRNLILFDIKHP